VEALDMDIDIGSKIRTYRKNRRLSIAELAKMSDTSAGMISQIERNLVVPSVTTIWKIAQAMGVNVGYFFDEQEEVSPVVRKNERKKLVIDESHGIYELLTVDLNRKIEFLSITLHSGESKSNEMLSHAGEECGIVIKGRLKVKLGEREYILEEGDSISFDSNIPHRYINIGEEESHSIWAMTPPSF
jgi:transcriptional regulator with XRE-family HTH domain